MDDGIRRLVAAERLDDAPVGAAGESRGGVAAGAAGHTPVASAARPPRRGASRRRRAWVAVPVAALATTAFTLGVTLPGGRTPAVVQPASAATVLADLQGKLAGAPAPRGRYAYLKQLAYTTHMRSGGETEVLPHESEQWVADDGSGVAKEVIHWGEKRPPAAPFENAPRAVRDFEVIGLSMDEIRALPTDPAALRKTLERRDNVIVTAYAGALLSFAGTPQDVKLALYSVLKSLPGAELIAEVTDPLGRTGVGVQFDDEAWRTLFLFDPATGALLGTRSIGKQEVPGRTITDWNLTVRSGRTDSAPRPRADIRGCANGAPAQPCEAANG
jgi:hypothetical protein